MAQPRPWSKKEDATLRKLHAEGLSLGKIAKRMGRANSTVSVKAKAAGLPFDRSQMEMAIQVSVFDARAARRRVIEKLYSRAEYLADRLDATRTGGEYRTLVPVGAGEQRAQNLNFVPPMDEKNTASALSIYLARAEALEKLDADGGMTEARGMVGSILAAIRASVEGVPRLNPTAPAKETATK